MTVLKMFPRKFLKHKTDVLNNIKNNKIRTFTEMIFTAKANQ